MSKNIKTITPMSRLQNSLNNLKLMISPHFNEINLNKAKSHFNSTAWFGDTESSTKGVNQDFITIFKCKNSETSFSIGFTYIDLPNEQHTINVGIKKTGYNSSIITSEEMTIDEFKMKLKNINKEIKSDDFQKNINEIKILQEISKEFIDQNYDLSSELKKANQDQNLFHNQKKKEYNIDYFQEQVDISTQEYQKADKKVKSLINKSAEKTEVEHLEILYLAAKRKFENKKQEIEKLYDLENLNFNRYLSENELSQASKTMERDLEEQKKKYSPIVAKNIKNIKIKK